MTTRARWQLAELLRRAQRDVSQRLSGALQEQGLTLDQWQVLSYLSDGSGHPMSGVAAHLRLPAATVTRIIDHLVEINLAYRRGDPLDGRRVLVFLSERGRRKHQSLASTIEREQLTFTVGLDKGELDVLCDLLDRLATGRD